MNDASGHFHQGPGALDHQGSGQAVPVGETRAGRAEERHRPVRARLVDGLAADLRPAGAGPAELLGHGLFRRARLRHLVRSTWRATAAPTKDARHRRQHLRRRRRPRGRHQLHLQDPQPHRPAAGLRHLVGRAARRAVRAASSEPREAARARRPCLDRRRQPDAGGAPQEAAGVPQDQAAADRPRVRALDLRARPSRHRRRQRDRSLRRRTSSSSTTRSRTAPISTCATTCRWSIRPRSWCRPSSCAASTTASRASRT